MNYEAKRMKIVICSFCAEYKVHKNNLDKSENFLQNAYLSTCENTCEITKYFYGLCYFSVQNHRT